MTENTPQAIAEKINKYISGFHSPLERENYIAVALMEYGNKEYIEGLEHGHYDSRQELDSQYRLGRKQALEEAAKIAEEGPKPGGVILIDGDVHNTHDIVLGWQKWIAKSIRALMEKPDICKVCGAVTAVHANNCPNDSQWHTNEKNAREKK